MKGILIVIEGLDFVGKTTIAKTIANNKNWVYYKTPPEKYYKQCVELGENGYPIYSEDRFNLFVKCLEYSSREICSLLNNGFSVVVDRWIWTTLSYHFAFNVNLEAKICSKIKGYVSRLISPHLNFLICVQSEKIYQQRVLDRKETTQHDKMVMNDKDKREIIFENFKRLNPSFVLVDNSNDFKHTMFTIREFINNIPELKLAV